MSEIDTPAALAGMRDRSTIRDLVEAWGFRRDAGEWEALADTFHPEGDISVSWFSGAFADFVAASRARAGRSFSKHVMGGSRVVLRGDRALSETDVFLFGRSGIDGVEVAGTTLMRFLDRVERRAGAWRLLSRVAVYDHDTLAPAVPGTQLSVPAEEIAGLPPGYRFLAWRLRRAGLSVPEDLPTRGSEAEDRRRAADAAWLLGEG
jgi:hypothetical protein